MGILAEIERVYAAQADYDVKEMFRASTLRQLGQIYFEAGVYEKALERFQESETIAKTLHQQGRLPEPDLNFGTLDMWIGDTHVKLGNLEAAEQRYLSMIEHRKRYFASHPEIAATIASSGHGRSGRPARRCVSIAGKDRASQAAAATIFGYQTDLVRGISTRPENRRGIVRRAGEPERLVRGKRGNSPR